MMDWVNKLERRYGRWAVPNLMGILVAGQAIVWVLIMFVYGGLAGLLPLSRWGLLHGQVWRLVTFVFVPTLTFNPLLLALELYFYWWVGTSLERAWGAFRFDLYYLIGMLGAILSCLAVGHAGTGGLYLSLFFAYAWMWPEQRVLLMFFLPIKVKWLGWIAAALWAVDFLTGDLATKVGLLFGLAGFLIFFGREIWDFVHGAAVSYRRRRDWQNKWK